MDTIQLGICKKTLVSIHKDDIKSITCTSEGIHNDTCFYEVWFRPSERIHMKSLTFVVESEPQNDYILNFIKSLEGEQHESN